MSEMGLHTSGLRSVSATNLATIEFCNIALTTTPFYSVQTHQCNSLSFWTKLAQLLDKAGFHAMFIADTLGAYGVYKGPVPALASGAQFPVNDPLYLAPAMSAVTKNLIFKVTASVAYEKPYALARRLSTTDHNM
ncbi:hypothetical protein VN97_g12386 [Penicillium thymicola]|uniref:Uncharacterized protein n=1 Tax=Penicillium thymicola TaxID=293382 RepID=A0AAI9T6E4_PENTH|nr:hypothetical protein VN97_g12386 [Penicillium thymicola]